MSDGTARAKAGGTAGNIHSGEVPACLGSEKVEIEQLSRQEPEIEAPVNTGKQYRPIIRIKGTTPNVLVKAKISAGFSK
jgi:hypothetical protein